MILQALTRYYEDLLTLGRISRPGWGTAKVSYGLELDDSGALIGLLSLETEQKRGKKSAVAAQAMEVPMPAKRTVGLAASFLCDHSGYLLGVDGKGNPGRTVACFAACKELHLQLLEGAASPAAKAVVSFFKSWNPAAAHSHPALADRWDALMKGANLVFWYRDAPVFKDPEVRERWQAHYDGAEESARIRCMVTGKMDLPPEKGHPWIKGVVGAQPSGAALVSFNDRAFWSYGHKDRENAPVGSYAAFAYTTALNYLLSDREHVQRLGNTTVVCWAEGGQSAYQDLGMAVMFGSTAIERNILSALKSLTQGLPTDWEDTRLFPDTRFYVLGLAPNAARLSVRFFWQNSFGDLIQNIQNHYKRLEIVSVMDNGKALAPWTLLQETVNPNARDKNPSDRLAGDLLQAVLNDIPYPASLLNGVTLRIRAEREITRGRAAILKAYYLKSKKLPEEVLRVELNEQSSYMPYVLGRLFSVLEAIQYDFNPNLNTTIKDKYFSAASATPAVVFPTLINLAQKHLRKLEKGRQVYYNKQLGSLIEKIGETYPARMALPEQGAFQIGYYHQTQKRYAKKEENENV